MLMSYEQYLQNYCYFPLFAGSMLLFLFLHSANGLKNYIKNHESNARKLADVLLPLGVSVVLIIYIVIIPLSRGNINLLREREDDAVRISGQIESIKAMEDTLYGQTRMYEFVINETKCVAVYVPAEGAKATTPFNAGERVEVLYLPLSGYILSIVSVNSP